MKTRTDFSEKPYNRCLTCPHRKVRCDGPRTAAMRLERWCEYMRDMKEANGLTNAYIAEESGVSIKTIERLMAQNCDQDIRRETARLIENAIIGSSNKFPCYLAFEESIPDNTEAMRELERALADNQEYKAALDSIHASYNAEMRSIREDAQKTIDLLLEELERVKKEADYLRLENDRKAKVIDRLLEN